MCSAAQPLAGRGMQRRLLAWSGAQSAWPLSVRKSALPRRVPGRR